MDQIHHSLTVEYPGITGELSYPCDIQDPVTRVRSHLPRTVWDTGASNTAINVTVAEKLGLIPTGVTTIHTANGSDDVNTYLIDLLFHNNVRFNSVNVAACDLGDTEMLIGMDVIAAGDFTVQNYNGKTKMSFTIPPFANKYDMVEKANTINRRVQKQASRRPPEPQL